MPSKIPLDDDSRNRIAMTLDQLADRLAVVETELATAYTVRNRPRKAVRRALNAADAAIRALDQL